MSRFWANRTWWKLSRSRAKCAKSRNWSNRGSGCNRKSFRRALLRVRKVSILLWNFIYERRVRDWLDWLD
jgi:hypothetical protein